MFLGVKMYLWCKDVSLVQRCIFGVKMYLWYKDVSSVQRCIFGVKMYLWCEDVSLVQRCIFSAKMYLRCRSIGSTGCTGHFIFTPKIFVLECLRTKDINFLLWLYLEYTSRELRCGFCACTGTLRRSWYKTQLTSTCRYSVSLFVR
jgi:hypothetical protein